MNVLITDKVDPLLLKLLDFNKISYEINLNDNAPELLKIITKFDGIIIRNRLNIDKYFLNQAQNLKFIARYGSGMECVDLKIAKELDIPCFNSAEGNANSVGEHALGMLLSLFHNIYNGGNELKNLIWEREKNRGIELENKSIGILGYGNTGKAFSKKFKGFNCRIMSYDKYKSGFGNDEVEECDMETIYSNADIISLHIPLNDDTKYLINNEFINKMGKPFYLINSSRGAIVSNNDLVDGLKKKKILGACLDVIENENSSFSEIKIDDNLNYLLNCKNVIITPHIAGLSEESNKKISKVLITKILKLQ